MDIDHCVVEVERWARVYRLKKQKKQKIFHFVLGRLNLDEFGASSYVN